MLPSLAAGGAPWDEKAACLRLQPCTAPGLAFHPRRKE